MYTEICAEVGEAIVPAIRTPYIQFSLISSLLVGMISSVVWPESVRQIVDLIPASVQVTFVSQCFQTASFAQMPMAGAPPTCLKIFFAVNPAFDAVNVFNCPKT